MINDIAKQVGISEAQASEVVELFCRRLHQTAYEYDRGNGDFLWDEIAWSIGDASFLHLYLLLLLYQLKYCETKFPDDTIGMAFEVLKYAGGAERWNDHFGDIESWKFASHFGIRRPYG